MRHSEAIAYAFEQIRDAAVAAVTGLDQDALVWRPDPEANTIAWLVWHLARVADSHVAPIAGVEQVWSARAWAPRFGLPDEYLDHGYGHTPEQVAAIAPDDAHVLVGYIQDVAGLVIPFVSTLTDEDLARVIDESYDPPVTAGVRLQSVIGDTWQHVGQAAYVRGLYQRRHR
jgi:hypothetical protein